MKLRKNAQNKCIVLPEDSAERKKWCVYSGVESPFPNALALLARLSYDGNVKHCDDNEPINWAMEKSDDHLDCMARHKLEEEWVHVAWRALANLEEKAQQGYNPWGEMKTLDNYYRRNSKPYLGAGKELLPDPPC
jgi:hypothetical protein